MATLLLIKVAVLACLNEASKCATDAVSPGEAVFVMPL